MSDKALTTKETFVVDLPDTAPVLGVDVNSPAFSWQDIYPDNYFNEDNLTSRKEALGGWPLYTVKGIVLKQVQDPEKPDPAKRPDLVLQFHETTLELVCNKSRCRLLAAIAGTQNPALWPQRLPVLELYIGKYKEMSNMPQILVREAPESVNGKVQAVNDELFG